MPRRTLRTYPFLAPPSPSCHTSPYVYDIAHACPWPCCDGVCYPLHGWVSIPPTPPCTRIAYSLS
jgi:hypothetical protein